MLTVLLAVEDNGLRETVRVQLASAGHAAFCVSRALALLSETRRTRWDVAIVDGGPLGRDALRVLAGLEEGGRPVLGLGFEDARLRRSLALPLDLSALLLSIAEVRPLVLHPDQRVARANGREVSLTRSECRLLERLLASRPREVSIAEAMEALWGVSGGTGTPAPLRSHIRNLRAKLGQIGLPNAVRSWRGRGYALSLE